MGWGGLIPSMYACGTTSCYVDVPFLHACTSRQCYVDVTFLHGCTSRQCYVDVTFLHGCYVVKSVVHMRNEWTRKVRVRGKTKVAGNQQIDRCWNHLKKNCPCQMKNRTGPTINARFWDRIYQWIYRHNMSKWDMTTTCEMEKQGSWNCSSSDVEIDL